MPRPGQPLPAEVRTRIWGGARLRAAIRRIRDQKPPSAVQVGYFEDAKYAETGTAVTSVAAWMEWGTRRPDGSTHVPARPTIRPSFLRSRKKIREMIRHGLREGTISAQLAGLVGETAASALREEIRLLSSPALAPSTIERKGSSKPLIDTGTLIGAVDHEVIP